MGVRTKLKERHFVINHFNNGKSLREIAEIIQLFSMLLKGIKQAY
jgi:hypothetical protein